MAEQTGTPPLIEMDEVSKIYEMGDVEVPALQKVSLRVHPGEFVAIMGPSGSGKTTLLNVIGCLDLPTEGSYRLQQRDVHKLNDAQLSRLRGQGLGFVFQNYSLLREFSALRNVELPYFYAKGRGNRERAMSLLARVGLAERARHKPTELSGGEQQRVAIARALMNNPFLLLADEPTGNLDTKSGQGLIDLLKELNAQDGLTILIVTHDPRIGEQTQRIIRMEDGYIVGDEMLA